MYNIICTQTAELISDVAAEPRILVEVVTQEENFSLGFVYTYNAHQEDAC